MSKPTANEIINQVAAAVQGAAHELTLFHYHDNGPQDGAIVFDSITQDFSIWIVRPDGLVADGDAADLRSAQMVLAERLQRWKRFDREHAQLADA